jgi:hypothetical protein
MVGTRIAVEDRPLVLAGVEVLADQRTDDGVADQLAGLHDGLGLKPDRRPCLDCRPQHVAG